MLAKNREFSTLTAASYLLAITVSALFHNHKCCGHQRPRPGVSASQRRDHDHDCAVCQFLAQKPAPAAAVAPVGTSLPVQEVVAASPVRAEGGVFSAWHSRAPPAVA